MLALCPETSGTKVVRGVFATLADHADSPSPRSSKTTIGAASTRTLDTYRQTQLPEAEFSRSGSPGRVTWSAVAMLPPAVALSNCHPRMLLAGHTCAAARSLSPIQSQSKMMKQNRRPRCPSWAISDHSHPITKTRRRCSKNLGTARHPRYPAR